MMLREARRLFEIEFFRKLLLKYRWHIPTVAKKAGIDPDYCGKKLDSLGLIRSKRRESME
jgi:hypothetical protein